MMTTITVGEALDRFGTLLDDATRIHRQFETPDGIWRPELDGARKLRGYRLFPAKGAKAKPKKPAR